MMLAALLPGAAAAVDKTSTAYQIELYTSAAPAFLSASATVIGSNGTVLKEGTNSWYCLSSLAVPATGWESARAASPICVDEVGKKWIDGYFAGTPVTLERDTYGWMAAGDTGYCNTNPMCQSDECCADGSFVASGAHMMLIPKDPTSLVGFPADSTKGEPYVMFPGSGYDHMMIPVEGYYDYHAHYSLSKKIEAMATAAADKLVLKIAPHRTKAWRKAAYASAAPAFLGAFATILEPDGTVLKEGTNGWYCTSTNPTGPADAAAGWESARAASPICVDEEGKKWMDGYFAGTPVTLSRDTYAWMAAGDTGYCTAPVG